MTYEQIVHAWNAQADEHNQYDTLSDRERIEFVLMMATRQEQPIAKIVCGTGGGCSLEFTNGADSLDYAGCDVYLRPPIAQEPHPPTRHCMCEDCAPSFEQTPDGLALAAFHDLPSGVVKHVELGDLFDRMQMHQYAMKYAMANNSAQAKPVEKQEPVRVGTTAPCPSCEVNEAIGVGNTELIEMLQAECASKQAKIDALMLEYCPNEMTAEQLVEWGEHQAPAECSECEKLKHELHCLYIEFGDVRDSYVHYKAECEKLKSTEPWKRYDLARAKMAADLQVERNKNKRLQAVISENEKLKAELQFLRPGKVTIVQQAGQITALKAERDELKNDLADMLDAKNGIGPTALSTVISQRDELAAQVMHWKANHASVVEQARILKERPDMPIERVKAYESWVAMAAQVEKMREVLEDIQKCEFAARVEGLVECLAAIDDEHRPAGRLKDLVERRLLYMARYADEALALPDLSAGILNRVRADALRKAVTLCEKHERWVQTGMGKQFKSWDAATVMAGTLASAIRTLAADMEAGKC